LSRIEGSELGCGRVRLASAGLWQHDGANLAARPGLCGEDSRSVESWYFSGDISSWEAHREYIGLYSPDDVMQTCRHWFLAPRKAKIMGSVTVKRFHLRPFQQGS